MPIALTKNKSLTYGILGGILLLGAGFIYYKSQKKKSK